MASVVIPTYNRSELLRLALTSVASQTLPVEDYEVIVAELGFPGVRVLLQPHGTFPRTPSGKLRHLVPAVEMR